MLAKSMASLSRTASRRGLQSWRSTLESPVLASVDMFLQRFEVTESCCSRTSQNALPFESQSAGGELLETGSDDPFGCERR